MNLPGSIPLFILFLIPAIIIVFLIMRLNRNQLKSLQGSPGRVSEFEGGPKGGLEAEAIVISKSETLSPKAKNIAKVDMLMEVHLPGKDTYRAATSWLVEVAELGKVSPGSNLQVKIDPQKPERVFPNVPWARFWVFGK